MRLALFVDLFEAFGGEFVPLDGNESLVTDTFHDSRLALLSLLFL